MGHRRSQLPHSTAPRLTPKRLIRRALGRFSREFGRLDAQEDELTKLLEGAGSAEQRLAILTRFITVSDKRMEIAKWLTDLEDKRMRNFAALIVAANKAQYPEKVLKELLAAGDLE